jgi:hypothetical protein
MSRRMKGKEKRQENEHLIHELQEHIIHAKKQIEFKEFKKKTIIQERNKYIRQHQDNLTFYRELLRQLGASGEETYTSSSEIEVEYEITNSVREQQELEEERKPMKKELREIEKSKAPAWALEQRKK